MSPTHPALSGPQGGRLTALDAPPDGGWTVDDLETFPEDGVRRELLDGVLLVRPSPPVVHQQIAMRLMAALQDGGPTEYDVNQGVQIRLGPRTAFSPDVLAVTEDAARRCGNHFFPGEVVLAIEVVAGASATMDRITKPALYAAAGIPSYWIVETDGRVTVRTYALDGDAGAYRATGEFDGTLEIDDPWPAVISLTELAPPFL
ncbi:Uma2 family endonuclease [Actinoplanes bogorensis]|uniref:Uma2 family endonuclease n=1 Tax=Paractinoplanes bogorensis TaxID=1610840 RepID=A0ABS5YYS7_9ACTN|nr:Uma2 family endonuclease [Actinoplanes bogorensis]MBU2668597.1 Uma2 family endonuclease [Actinoplanes bogorensis]